ncbi:MAG: 3-hydroxyacyl-ACP dehydratase FabZ [Pseudomonadota bacterium]
MTANHDAESLAAIDIDELLKVLPHRAPFLLIDRIEKIDGNKSAVGIKNVTYNEPFFQGHFPAKPVMPGVLLIEGMAQTCAAIGIRNLGTESAALVYFMTIDRAKFRRPVGPGDVVEYHVSLIKMRGRICKYQCVAMVRDEKVAEAEVSAVLDPETDE